MAKNLLDDGQDSSPAYSAAANPFIGDAGQFDPETAKQVHQLPNTQPLEEIGWKPEQIRRGLKIQGLGTHDLIGVGDDDWLWRKSELDLICDPLASVLNKFPVAQAASEFSDEVTVLAVLGRYTVRSVNTRRRLIRAAKLAQQATPAPVTGVNAAGHRISPDGQPWPASAPEGVPWEVQQ